ncbi:MAG: hypothetical protein ACI37V_08245 [Methanobrevibacter sp.]
MKDYNIVQALKILKNITKEKINLIPHASERCELRNIPIDYVICCLIERIPLSISKTTDNRFKLIFPHKNKKSKKELYIIIEIDDFEKINVITVYYQKKERRERGYSN